MGLLEKEVKKVRVQHTYCVDALLKRIQRDRDEQLTQRQQDSRILIQRNKNMLVDVITRQQQEKFKTEQFLKYALSKRDHRVVRK